MRLPRSTALRHLLMVVAIALILLGLSTALDPYQDTQLTKMVYTFTALAGLTVLTGVNGQISLGHGALMAVGAYSVVILVTRTGFSLLAAIAAATAITALVGSLVGVVAARLRGPYLAGATLAFAVGIAGLADRYPSAFGGENGLTMNPPFPPAGIAQDVPLERWETWIAGVGALLVLFVLANLLRSRLGRTFRAVRDDEVAAGLAGLDVARTQVLAFVVSAACAGLAGAMLAATDTQTAAPGAFTLALSLALLTGIVLGGLGSLWGAAWGAIVLVLLPSWTDGLAHSLSLSDRVQANLPLALYGVVLIGLMIAAPHGLQGALRRVGHFVRARAARPTSPPTQSEEAR